MPGSEPPSRYYQSCSMPRDQADRVLRMLETHEDWGIRMTIRDSENGRVGVDFSIPEGVDTLAFYGGMYHAINPELGVTIRGERGR